MLTFEGLECLVRLDNDINEIIVIIITSNEETEEESQSLVSFACKTGEKGV
jgi:hypothetical protein